LLTKAIPKLEALHKEGESGQKKINQYTRLLTFPLAIIQSIKRRWPHVDIWLTQTDGRHAALADAMRLGADGLLSDDGLHRTAIAGSASESLYSRSEAGSGAWPVSAVPPVDPNDSIDPDIGDNEPILTADELRALLAEQPMTLPEDEGE